MPAWVAGWWTPLRVLLALGAFTLLLGYAEKLAVRRRPVGASKQYTHACYSDVIPLWGAEGLSSGAVPYRDHAVEYPVLTGGFMWVTGELTRAWHSLAEDGTVPGQDEGVVFGVLTCVLLAVCGLLTVAATAAAAGRRRQWDAAILALSPLLVFHAFSNWDLLAMAFASGGAVGVGARPAGGGRRADRAGRGRQAVPGAAVRAAGPAGLPQPQLAAGAAGPRPRRPVRGWR